MVTNYTELSRVSGAPPLGCGLAKWSALINDVVVPLPRREVKATVVKAQASVADNDVLVRDHNSPNDVVIDDGDEVDLAHGNVFYTLPRCETQPRAACTELPKLAFFVDDRPEVTVRSAQTGRTLRELFGLPLNSHLVRDDEGKTDEPIALDDPAEFKAGPVFYSRAVVATLSITVNSRLFTEADGVKKVMKGHEIAALVYPQNPRETRVWEVSPQKREIGLDADVEIHCGEVFDVVRKKVDGGFEAPRVELELAKLSESGQVVTSVENPAAVIYHDLRTRPGHTVASTDVLVLIPSGYPGQMIDEAFLPQGSPLIGRVKGQPQGQLTAAGRGWTRISYHPHNGGGGPPWNPAVHGFHTYIGELLSWLYDAN
ncbi:MAG TPA: hypothetical protein DC054_25590 [Blastocatellia bacterium]|nr:hypothetical protein [Blastocatellia bacterium]